MDDTSRRVSREALADAMDDGLDEDSARAALELRSEIAHTRADISETIDAIQEKLRPGHIAAAAADRVKQAATTTARTVAGVAVVAAEDVVGTTRRTAHRLARDRRMSTAGAIVGIAAAWLIIDRWRRSRR
jgi:hypothetical protein